MSKYKFGYDNGGKNKDLQCVSLYNNETKEISLFFKEEDIAKQKDARIAELEKENQTAVKEFADEILNMQSNYSAKEEADIFRFYDKFQDNIKELLKERGIE